MYKETDAVTAFMQYKIGGNGYILHDNGESWPFKDSFKQFDNARFIVEADGQAEKEILEAWKGGDRSIKEIMEITGYSYPTVRKYIPINEKG